MNKVSAVSSFSAADTLPVKLLQSPVIQEIVNTGVIPPVHVQFIPTNKCNLDCPFCSCALEDRDVEMSLPAAKCIIPMLAGLGTLGVTITGGGEPLMHPEISSILHLFHFHKIQVGLVTNGLLLSAQEPILFDRNVTWCRISHSDSRSFTHAYAYRLGRFISSCKNVDWAFSYVVSEDPDMDNIERILKFAHDFKFTHIRLVADILHHDTIDMGKLRNDVLHILKEIDVPVIFQGRNTPERGMPCYICYLKPMIGADLKVYTCCGAQYALDPPSKALPKELCLGDAINLPSIIENSRTPFNGSICKVCYYGAYNRVLGGLLSPLTHEVFV